MGKLFCLIGKSASGKDAIFRYLRDNKELGLKEIVPYTTRPMRKGEENGVGYYFVDQAAYEKMCQNGKVIESRTYETINGPWHYFTVDDGQIRLDRDNAILIGTLEVYNQMKRYFGEEQVVPLYIEVEDGLRLERALARERMQDVPNCDRYFSQPDCDIGWDSSRDCYYHGYDLYMLVDSQSDLPVFPHFSCASKHDSHGFLHAFFRMKSFLPEYSVSKVLLDSTHDAMPYYQYLKRENITPFIDLNGKGGRPPVYKNDFTIDKDGGPICPSGFRMRRDGVEVAKGRMKFKCPKISHAGCTGRTADSCITDSRPHFIPFASYNCERNCRGYSFRF